LNVVRDARGVLAAEPVPPEASAAILAPFFGDDGAEALGLRLVDLTLAAPADTEPGRAILDNLDAAIRAAGLRGEIDSHATQAARLAKAAESVQGLAAFALAAIAATCALLTVLACHTALAAQAHVVDVLRMVGARDGYIVRLFVRRLQFLTLLGGALGAAIAALALAVGPGAATSSPPSALAPLLPELSLNFETALRFALAPLALALIATFAAWASGALRLRSIER
ncbi:MAG: FtsX-like permease family protein, partial [Pseudomonadota bacterium]